MIGTLPTNLRVYLLGYFRGDAERAEAVVEVIFFDIPYRQAAMDHLIPLSTLHREVARTRRDLRTAIGMGRLSTADLGMAPLSCLDEADP